MEWQPIDTAPKDETMFLVCLPRLNNLIIRARYIRLLDYFITDLDNDGATLFHVGDVWMPLPDPPHDLTHR